MNKHMPKSKKKKIIKMYLDGESPKAICDYYSIPKSTFYTWIYKSENAKYKRKKIVVSPQYHKLKDHTVKVEHELEMLQAYLDCAKVSRKQRMEFMDTIWNQYNIHEVCDAFNIDRGTYYYHLKSKDKLTKSEERHAYILEQVRNIHEESHRTYGAKRIRIALRKQGIKVGEKYVRDIMHELGIIQYKADSKKRIRNLMWSSRKENLFLKGYKATNTNQI